MFLYSKNGKGREIPDFLKYVSLMSKKGFAIPINLSYKTSLYPMEYMVYSQTIIRSPLKKKLSTELGL